MIPITRQLSSALRPCSAIAKSLSQPRCAFSVLSDRQVSPLPKSPIPGLIYLPKFLDAPTCDTLIQHSLQLDKAISSYRETASSYRSQGHNLPFEKHYKLIHFPDISPTDNTQPQPATKQLNAQSFTGYGSPGHDLTYFINNANIPEFIQNALVSRISNLHAVAALAQASKTPLNWRFTFNTYKQDSDQQAGFAWHKDIATNGDITSITTILGNATFQIRPENAPDDSDTHSLALTPGSIVLLSDEARWSYEHRVLPQPIALNETIGRISLVLGCR